MSHRPLVVVMVVAALSGAIAKPANAQRVCRPGPGSNEAHTMAQLSVPLALAPFGGDAPRPATAWAGLEFSYLPNIDEETRTPTACRPGKEPENANIADVLPRPRVGIALPAHLSLEASWVPPITVNQVRANLVGIALRWAVAPTPRWSISLRAHATVGVIRAPITCPDEALLNAASECFGGTRSEDRFHPNIVGLDAAVGGHLAGGRLHPYVGAGYSRLASRFQVHFVNVVGTLDNTRVIVNLDRATLFGGVLWSAGGGIDAGGEIYSAPSDGVTGRLLVRARFGS